MCEEVRFTIIVRTEQKNDVRGSPSKSKLVGLIRLQSVHRINIITAYQNQVINMMFEHMFDCG